VFISCQQSSLSDSLSLVSRAAVNRPFNPILANILLTADENLGLKLSASNETFWLEAYCGSATVYDGGEIALPARTLQSLVACMPQGKVELEVGNSQAMIRSYDAQNDHLIGAYRIVGLPGEEYPALEPVKSRQAILERQVLLEGLKMALFAASTDETKPILTGVHLQTTENTLEFVATNGHRIAIVNIPLINEYIPMSVTIPSKSLKELMRLLTKWGGDEIYLALESNRADFQLTKDDLFDQRLTTALLNGVYPDYHKIIPQAWTHQILLNREDLIGAIQRLSILAGSRNIIKLLLKPDSLTLKTEMGEFGDGEEYLAGEIQGAPLILGLNAKYILEGLSVMESQQVKIQLNSAKEPVVFLPVESTKMTYIVMPMQINSTNDEELYNREEVKI